MHIKIGGRKPKAKGKAIKPCKYVKSMMIGIVETICEKCYY
jgi:hypothetical protein